MKEKWFECEGKVKGREEEVRVCWKRDGKGGLWVKMKLDGKWVFGGRLVLKDVLVEVDDEDE